MPIKPENRALYPEDWQEISAAIRERAGHRCEWCGAKDGWDHPITGSEVVLTVAHLDHDPTNCDPENLKALCQRCHNGYDAPGRAWRRKYKVDERQMDMGREVAIEASHDQP